MNSLMLNPFIYGRPVPVSRFVGRQRAVRTIFSRLYNGESTTVVGEPHIGKTSLMRFVGDESTRRKWMPESCDACAFAAFDAHLADSAFTPADFWRDVLTKVSSQLEDPALRAAAAAVVQEGSHSGDLERFFQLVADRDATVVLLLDEFDALLSHSHLGTPTFLHMLRALGTRDGLCLVVASRLNIAQIHRRVVQAGGSPPLNFTIEVRLPQLSPAEAEKLLEDTLAQSGSGVHFGPADLALIYSLAGRHPFLLQIAGASLFDLLAEEPDVPHAALHARAEDLFHAQAAAHFDDFWRTLDEADQRTLLVLALAEHAAHIRHEGRAVEPPVFPWFEGDILRLVDCGAAVMHGTRPAMAVGGLRRWLIENVVGGNRYAPNFAAWLRAKGDQNLLADAEVDALRRLADELLGAARPSEAANIRQLHESLVAGFSPAELNELASYVGVDPGRLGGDEVGARSLNLILACQRISRLDDLRAEARRLRPNLPW